ncbi:VWA domain-containing protein [Nocardioides sp.]|uniref:VWA domain-containing protein n=1 Tax=Nocardioides sp. TaxID=35761 RepID=UPI003528779C
MPGGTHAAGSSSSLRGLALVAVVGVMAAAVSAGLWWTRQDEPPAASSSCTDQSLSVAVPAALAEVATTAAAALSDDCRTLTVDTREASEVADAAASGDPLPDLWLTDAPWTLTGLAEQGVQTEVVAAAVASSPVLLVGGPAAASAPTWGDELAAGVVALPDPASDPVGTLALSAPQAEEEQVGRSDDETKQLLVPLAQGYAELRADDVTADTSLDTLTASSTRVVATSEQSYLESRRGNDLLQMVTPGTGAPLLQYSLVTPADADQAVAQAAADLAAWFASGPGDQGLADARLRRGDGSMVVSRGARRVDLLPAPSAEQVLTDLRTWQVLSVPSSVLGVFDVSGSMDELEGAQTRAQLAAGVVSAGLDAFPDSARVGLWAFSIDLGGPGQDWRVMQPVRRLDETVEGVSQRDLLKSSAATLPDITTGGTGLYDTTLAAYRQALKDYDANYANSVILLTDGANDDPGSISLSRLLDRLEELRDPQRPVRIIGLAISEDADFAALRKIARATGGKAYRAADPATIGAVFNEAISSR